MKAAAFAGFEVFPLFTSVLGVERSTGRVTTFSHCSSLALWPQIASFLFSLCCALMDRLAFSNLNPSSEELRSTIKLKKKKREGKRYSASDYVLQASIAGYQAAA